MEFGRREAELMNRLEAAARAGDGIRNIPARQKRGYDVYFFLPALAGVRAAQN